MELGFVTGMGMIENIEVVSDYVVRFNFNKELRLGDLDQIFRVDIVTQAAYEADPNGMSANPVGTGPYALTSYTAGNSFTYTALSGTDLNNYQMYKFLRDSGADTQRENVLTMREGHVVIVTDGGDLLEARTQQNPADYAPKAE